MYAVADRLAQPEDAWTPFRAPALLCSAFPRPDEPEAEQFPAAAA
jgi:hypothetical protein